MPSGGVHLLDQVYELMYQVAKSKPLAVQCYLGGTFRMDQCGIKDR